MAIDFLKLAHLNSEARKALANLRLIEKERDRLVGDTRKLANSLKREQITLALSQLPVERLREVADIRVPVEALRRHGLVNVGDIYSRSTSFIGALSGISPTTAYELKEVVEKMAEAGVAVIGGHSIKDAEIKAGFAVTGVVDPARVTLRAGARPAMAIRCKKAP